MSRHTKDRKKRQKEKLAASVRQENTVFDILGLVETENTDTKPNMGKFLKNYVKDVRAIPKGMVQFYPEFRYSVQRVFVSFLDGHELIFYPDKRKTEDMYVCMYMYEDVELKPCDIAAVARFFENLFAFGFVREIPAVPRGFGRGSRIISIDDEDRRRDSQVPGVED